MSITDRCLSKPLNTDSLVAGTSNVFKIRLHAGLGDVFRMWSEHPSIELFYETYGLTIYWVYSYDEIRSDETPEQYIDTDDLYTRPMHIIVLDIFKHVPFLKNITQREFDLLDVPELYNWNNRDNTPIYLRNIFPNEQQGFKFPLTIDAEKELNDILNKSEKTICVQYSGRDPIKNYPVDSYIKLFNMLLEKYPTANILLIDRPDKIIDNRVLFDPRIVSLVGKISRVQEINLICRVDYLISPCSYSKYVRRWANGKQTILANHYNYHSDTVTLNDVFGHYKYHWRPGLIYNPLVTVLGAHYPNEEDLDPNYEGFTLDQISLIDHISKIAPEEIFNSVDI